MYADFSFYKNTYNGALSEADFKKHSTRAGAEINRITFNRAATATSADETAVKYAECAVIDELAYQSSISEGGAGDVVSESNDGISRTYSGAALSSRQRIKAAADLWLCNTNLCAVPI